MTQIKVRDLNYGAHLSNDALVGILHEARIDFLHQMNCTELDLGDGATGIIMRDLVVNYKAQGYLLDDMVIHSHIGELSTASFRVFHKIMGTERMIALAETGIVTFRYQDNTIAEVPAAFLSRLASYGIQPSDGN